MKSYFSWRCEVVKAAKSQIVLSLLPLVQKTRKNTVLRITQRVYMAICQMIFQYSFLGNDSYDNAL